MALSNIEKHYNKHPEDLRLQRRHGIVEFETTMHHLRRFLRQDSFLLDIGAGTGRYTSALMAEGYRVKAVELVRRNIEVFLKREPAADVVQGDARDMPFIPTATADVTLLLGLPYTGAGGRAVRLCAHRRHQPSGRMCRTGAGDHLLARRSLRLYAHTAQPHERRYLRPLHRIPEGNLRACRPYRGRQSCGGCG